MADLSLEQMQAEIERLVKIAIAGSVAGDTREELYEHLAEEIKSSPVSAVSIAALSLVALTQSALGN
ncbi:MAG TPA: hypothetical protein VD928_00340 [Candidatus Paceibacterota bacterium]|nr:hypothetical protein [Candidatus Paceibacterota bacterium]